MKGKDGEKECVDELTSRGESERMANLILSLVPSPSFKLPDRKFTSKHKGLERDLGAFRSIGRAGPAFGLVSGRDENAGSVAVLAAMLPLLLFAADVAVKIHVFPKR